jgi:ATP-binding cassette subfamily B protein
MRKFPFYAQLDRMDCGPTCLRMIAKYYGKQLNIQLLREKCGANRAGVSLLTISRAAETLGFRTRGVIVSYEDLATKALLPCIAHWDKEHFVVVYRIKGDKVFVADPSKGSVVYTRREFCQYWLSTQAGDEARGTALLVEPTAEFEELEESTAGVNSGHYFALLLPYKRLIIQLGLGLLIGSVLQLLFPFLTKSVVDIGIRNSNLSFVYLILAAQLVLFLGRISIDFIQSWILLHISSRVSVTILSDFLIKLMRLPLSFFDVKMFGDIMQRMNDQRRIEQFLTNTSLASVFSLFSLLIFSGVLLYFNGYIFLVFGVASLLYVGWVSLFMKNRRVLDFRRFDFQKKEQSAMVELINGMQDIKISNAESQKRWYWEGLRARLFRLTSQSLALTQYQEAGGHIINEGKNIFVTFLSAKAVINGSMSLGTMLAIQYIIGQLNGPVNQLITFAQAFQDATISMERLNDIHNIASEETDDKPLYNHLPETRDHGAAGTVRHRV